MARDPELDRIIQNAKTKQFRDGEAKGLLSTIGDELKKQLAPLFEGHSKAMTDKVGSAVADAIKGLRVDVPKQEAAQVHVNVPDVHVPDFTIPTPQVTVHVPKVEAPIVNIPAPVVNFPQAMRLTPNDKPFPVVLHDVNGKPFSFSMGASGGKADFFTVLGIANSVAIMQTDSSGVAYSGSNPFPVTITSGASSTTATNIVDSSGIAYSGSNPVPVVFGASATQAVNMVDSSGVAYSGSNPLPTTASLSVPVGQGDSASALRIIQAGDSVSSVVINSGTITTVTSITNSLAASLVDSGGVQYSGSNPVPVTGTLVVSSVTASIAAALIDSGGVEYSGSNPVPITGTVTGITNTIAVMEVDSTGIGYSGSNPFPITGTVVVSSITNTTATNIVDSTGVAYTTSNPLPISVASSITQNVTVAGVTDSTIVMQARTTLPTAVADGADVRPKGDKLGRALMRPVQVRDLIATAYVTLSTGTEATLLAAVAGNFLDLISVIAVNTSTAAIQCDIRATTAGNIVQTLYIPAGATAGWVPTVPWPQDNQGNNWTVDMGDFTNTSLIISALFSKEI